MSYPSNHSTIKWGYPWGNSQSDGLMVHHPGQQYIRSTSRVNVWCGGLMIYRLQLRPRPTSGVQRTYGPALLCAAGLFVFVIFPFFASQARAIAGFR